MDDERRSVVVAIRLSKREHHRWLAVALREDLRLVELIREATREHLRQLERLRLLALPVPTPRTPTHAEQSTG